MSQNKRIKAVTFDLWETLIFESDGQNTIRMQTRCQNLRHTLDSFGIKIPTEQFALAFKEMTPWLETIWKNNRDVTHTDQIKFIVKAASKNSINLKKEWINQLSEAYTSSIFEIPPILNPDAQRVLQYLKDNGKRVGLICNTGLTPGTVLREFLSNKGVAKHFDVMLFSDEIGIRKPDQRIFQIAAQQLETEPSNMVHVGDNLKCDVWGAQNAGFKAILLEDVRGRDRIAESDPESLISISRKLGNLKREQIVPDKTVKSLAELIEAIKEFEVGKTKAKTCP